jgi:hypothetical protein
MSNEMFYIDAMNVGLADGNLDFADLSALGAPLVARSAETAPEGAVVPDRDQLLLEHLPIVR